MLPAVSLGLWHNFGDDSPLDGQRAILRRAFDLGVTHFDLANNYGPPAGLGRGELRPPSSREDFARLPRRARHLHQGRVRHVARPYGDCGSRKYLLASLDQSLKRMGLDYVDIFYSPPARPGDAARGDHGRARHRRPQRQGALRRDLVLLRRSAPREAVGDPASLGTPLLIHQPSYSMLNRWVEDGLLDVLGEEGVGCVAFSPARPGLLTDRYLQGVPPGARAAQGKSLDPATLGDATIARIRALDEIAAARGQKLAQMALSWVLRDERVTSVVIGASSVEQLEIDVAALTGPEFTDAELAAIDEHVARAEAGTGAGAGLRAASSDS